MNDLDDGLANALASLLHRSNDLHGKVLSALYEAEFDDCPRSRASLAMCSVSLEHGVGLRLLVSANCPTSAVSLMRLQFEAMTRAKWALWAASDSEIAKLMAPLTLASEQAAKNLPVVNEMLAELGKLAGTKVPQTAYQMLAHFKDVQWKPLNSFVHGGIHSLRRHADGFPIQLVEQIVRSSNGLTIMAAMTLAVLSGEPSTAKLISLMQRKFDDCLPPLVPR